MSGDGSSTNPYAAECSDPQHIVCTVKAFPGRSLTGLWKNEYAPACQCPSSPRPAAQPPLRTRRELPDSGRRVTGLGPIGVSVTGFKTKTLLSGTYTIGTEAGWANSSVTSWDFGTNSYQVQLHCTNNTAYAFKL